MRSYIDRGYTVVKKKIGGASLDDDLRRIDAVLSVLQDGQKLAVDANGRFDRDTAIRYAKALSQYDLFWYEEPGDPLDFELQATLRNYYDNPMATGEDPVLDAGRPQPDPLRRHARGPRLLQFDCALSYGLVEYLRTLDMLHQHGWSRTRCIPHGGHQMSLNIAAGLGLGGNESYPDLFQPFGGFPDGVKVENGYITMPDLPASASKARLICSRRCRRCRRKHDGSKRPPVRLRDCSGQAASPFQTGIAHRRSRSRRARIILTTMSFCVPTARVRPRCESRSRRPA